MHAARQLPCVGGPLDGETHADVGVMFTHVATVRAEAQGAAIRPGFQSGVYRLDAVARPPVYRWVPA